MKNINSKTRWQYAYVYDHAYIARDEKGKARESRRYERHHRIKTSAEQDLREMNIRSTHSLPGIARLDLMGVTLCE